jgi:acetoacetyl-CoA synthetase
MSSVLWTPHPDALDTTRIGSFAKAVDATDPRHLHRWSINEPDEFWPAVIDHLAIPMTAPECVRSPPENGDLAQTRWFPGSRLNYAQAALQHAGDIAVVAVSDTRPTLTVTATELRRHVGAVAGSLRALGINKGDIVVASSPVIPETLIAQLAVASLGAIWASCAPEMGVDATVDRFGQLAPKACFVVDGYRHGPKVIDRQAANAEIRARLSDTTFLSIPYLGVGHDDWSSLLAAEPVAPEAVAFDHPLHVLFSSGTTGRPKAIVHGHGGIIVEHAKALAIHHDLGIGDRFAWATTTSWMMWNYMVSALLVGATVVMLDGDTPARPGGIFGVAAEVGVTVLGTSPPYLAAQRAHDRTLETGRLREVSTTGSPLAADLHQWAAASLGGRIPVTSISGGTDVCSAFLGDSRLRSIVAGTMSGPTLGWSVQATDDHGLPRVEGEPGELIIDRAAPSMPLYFWNDEDRTTLRATYFDKFPGRWAHGDWLRRWPDGRCQITGRSDATLNRSGVRLGTAEIYEVVDAIPNVEDSLVIHLDHDGLDVMVLLVHPRSAVDFDVLVDEIRVDLRERRSHRHVPDYIIEAPSIPRTASGKRMEIAVKRYLTDPSSTAHDLDDDLQRTLSAFARQLASGDHA